MIWFDLNIELEHHENDKSIVMQQRQISYSG